MTDQHPITPPPELVQEWGHDANLSGVPYDDETGHWEYEQYIAARAAQWSADQELEACIDWISEYTGLEHPELLIELLRAARRPKPLNLKEQALEELNLTADPNGAELSRTQVDLIRRALEALPE